MRICFLHRKYKKWTHNGKPMKLLPAFNLIWHWEVPGVQINLGSIGTSVQNWNLELPVDKWMDAGMKSRDKNKFWYGIPAHTDTFRALVGTDNTADTSNRICISFLKNSWMYKGLVRDWLALITTAFISDSFWCGIYLTKYEGNLWCCNLAICCVFISQESGTRWRSREWDLIFFKGTKILLLEVVAVPGD
jgi:hypothetical protein